MANVDEQIRYHLIKQIGTLSERTIQGKTWCREVNVIAWNGRPPKLDIRDWQKDNHRFMSKGITLDMREVKELKKLIKEVFI